MADTLKLTCGCGATLEYTGAYVGERHREFNKHQHERPLHGVVLVPETMDDQLMGELAAETGMVVIRGPKELLTQIKVYPR